ncbi:MAG: hypothetical protein QOE53_246 [Pseudonocardiales bacterium]|nr:hypothetical protein [Pseudonocardiales bacterium]
MTAPHRDDLEQRLAELFQQRASTVTRARPVDFGSGEGPLKAPKATAEPRQVRLGTRRQNLGVLAAAAAVFVAIAATVLGIQAHRQQPAPPLNTGSHPVSTPTASPIGVPSDNACQAPVSWRQAIAGGTVPVDHTLNTVVSADGGTGDYLAVQGNEPPPQTSAIYSDVELALFHGATGRTIYTPTDSFDIPEAHPTGAITADWVVFAVSHPQSTHPYKVMLYDRSSGRVTTLAEASDRQYAQGRAFIGSPVIAAGKVYWLAAVYNKPASTTLDSWDLARDASAGSVPAANATELISYGSGMIVSYGTSDQSGYPLETRTALRNTVGRPLTEVQLAAAARGTNFGYDGAEKLSWLWHDNNGSVNYENLIVGGRGTNSESVLRQTPGSRPALYPFVDVVLADSDPASGQNALVDLRTGRAVALPAGVELQAVVGDSVVFGAGATKAGAAGLRMVALSALPPVSC